MAKLKEEDEPASGSYSNKETLRKRNPQKYKDKNDDQTGEKSQTEDNTRKTIKEAPKALATRQIAMKYMDRESYLKLCIREMLVFLVFLIILGILASGHHYSSEYYLTRGMKKLFTETKFKTYLTNEIISYDDVTTLENVWDYFHFYQRNIFWNFWFGNYLVNETLSDEDKNLILYENKLIGRPRVRQLRVRNDSCTVPDDFQLMFAHCYAEYSKASEDTSNYGPENVTSKTAWSFHEAGELGSLAIKGEISTYQGGGYYFDFEPTMEETNKTVMNLFNNLWLDRGSRALIMQFTTYNVNINLFFTLILLLELPPTGGVLPSYVMYTHKFVARGLWDMILLGLFGVFVLFILWFSIEEIFELLYFKWHYFDSFWNALDLLIILFGYITIGFFIYQYLLIQSGLGKLIEKTEEFACFDSINSARETYIILLAILFFFSGIKILKYINFNHSMHQMQTTLAKATKDISCFSIIFFIVFITFAQLGHLLFGSQVRDFRSFVDSVFALLRTAVGDFDYHKIENVNHFLGPVYFFAYIFFIYFILVNMFLAIIIDTYSEVRSSIRDQAKELQMGDIFLRWFRKLMRLCGCKKIADKHDKPLPMGGAEGSAFEDIQNLLRRCGFNDQEIDLFFSKFGIPKDKVITQDEMRQKLLQNFNLEAEADRMRGMDQEKDEMGEKLMQRIRLLEDNITDVNYKIDLIDNKIDAIQQIRARRRTMQSQAGPSSGK